MPSSEIQSRKLMLSLPYFGVMSVFGLLVGALILQQSAREQRAQKAKI